MKKKAFLKICSTKVCLIVFSCFFYSLVFTALIFAAPEVSTFLGQDRISLNKPFDLYCEISWEGEAEDYMITPPELDLPKEILLISSSLSSSTSSEIQLITYRYILKSCQKGLFVLEPLQIKYWPAGDNQERYLSANDVSVEVTSFDFFGLSPTWIAASAVGLFLAFTITAFITKKAASKKMPFPKKEVLNKDCLIKKVGECKKHKIRGDYTAFYRSAKDMAENFFEEDKDFAAGIAESLEKMQFGGSNPASEEIERTFRYIEKKTAGNINSAKE